MSGKVQRVTVTMIELWLFLHTVCDIAEFMIELTPDGRLEWSIMFQPED